MPDAATGDTAASAYREELSRLSRVTLYLRIVFSTIMLAFTGFGPGLLLRFPFTGSTLALGPMSRFYAYRPVVFALLFAALSCVLVALSRRALVLFRELSAADRAAGGYLRYLRPPLFPFVLSGSTVIDLLVFLVVLAAYAFWVIALVETTPMVLRGYQAAGVMLGSYGLFAAVIVTTYGWLDAHRRYRAITSAGTTGTGTAAGSH
jgi:hypothetical protein